MTASAIQADAQPSSAEVAAPAQQQVAVAIETQDSSVVNGSGLPETQAVGTAGSADQTPAAVQQGSTAARNDAELPPTASPLPLSGLIALLSLAGAAGIRAFRL